MGRLACERASDADRADLVSLAADLPPTLDDFRATDRAFHSTIARASGNPVLAEVHAKALAALFGSDEFASLLYAEVNRREVEQIIRSATDAHRAIAAAIDARRPTAYRRRGDRPPDRRRATDARTARVMNVPDLPICPICPITTATSSTTTRSPRPTAPGSAAA